MGMKESELPGHLQNIVRELGFELRWDEGKFSGGACRLEDCKLFFDESAPSQF